MDWWKLWMKGTAKSNMLSQRKNFYFRTYTTDLNTLVQFTKQWILLKIYSLFIYYRFLWSIKPYGDCHRACDCHLKSHQRCNIWLTADFFSTVHNILTNTLQSGTTTFSPTILGVNKNPNNLIFHKQWVFFLSQFSDIILKWSCKAKCVSSPAID